MKTISRVILYLCLSVLVCATILAAYWLGRIDGALAPSRHAEIPMCVSNDTQIRQSPTGYILGDVPAGAMVWFMKLDLPFAQVAYYDGSSWLEGTVPAFTLEVCHVDK